MQKFLKLFGKFQKWIMAVAAVLAALTFVGALGFITDMYPMIYFCDVNDFGYIKGCEVFLLAQDFNRLYLNLALGQILLVIPAYLFFAHSRRIFYLSNYITLGILCATMLALGVFVIVNTLVFRGLYLQVDFDALIVALEKLGGYKKTTLLFDLQIALGFLLILSAISIALLCLHKFLEQKEERKHFKPSLDIIVEDN